MKSPFVQPRFEGARFVEHTLPLDVARDLAAYETLVVELAKHLYLRDHPGRQRVPKGFTRNFHLHLDKVDEGSARPLLSVVAAGALALGAVEGCFERARELIAHCIAAPEGQPLPEEFPRELLAHFNQVGRSLRADEQMELTTTQGTPAVLTPKRRKQLVLAADNVYEQPVDLSGTLVAGNWEKPFFQLRLADGSSTTVPMPQSFRVQARACAGNQRKQVNVRGVGEFDSWDRLQKVTSVEAIDVQDDYQLANRFDELRALSDGWHDGAGFAPPEEKLDQLASQIVGHYPEQLPLPAIIPTPEGNLLLEWDAPGSPSVDLRLSDMVAEFHAFHREEGDIEREFQLAEATAWPEFFRFLAQHVRQPAA